MKTKTTTALQQIGLHGKLKEIEKQSEVAL